MVETQKQHISMLFCSALCWYPTMKRLRIQTLVKILVKDEDISLAEKDISVKD